MIPSVGLGIDLDGDEVRPYSVVSIHSPQYHTIHPQVSADPIHNMILQHSPPRSNVMMDKNTSFEDLFKTNTSVDDILGQFRSNLAFEKKQRDLQNADNTTVVVDDAWNMDFDLDAMQNAREQAIKQRDINVNENHTTKHRTTTLHVDDSSSSSDDGDIPVAPRVGRGTVSTNIFKSAALPTPKSTLVTPKNDTSSSTSTSKSNSANNSGKKQHLQIDTNTGVEEEIIVSSYYPQLTTPLAQSQIQKSEFDDDGYDSDFGPYNAPLHDIREDDDEEDTHVLPPPTNPMVVVIAATVPAIAVSGTIVSEETSLPPPMVSTSPTPMIVMTTDEHGDQPTKVFDNRRATVISGELEGDFIPPPPPLQTSNSNNVNNGLGVPETIQQRGGSFIELSGGRRGSMNGSLSVPGTGMTRRGSASIISLASKFEATSPSPTTPDRGHRTQETEELSQRLRGSVSAMARRFDKKAEPEVTPEDQSDDDEYPVVIASEQLALSEKQTATKRNSIDARVSATLITPECSPIPVKPRQAQMSLSFNTLPVKAVSTDAATGATGSSGLFQLLSQTGTLRVVKRGKNNERMGGTGKMVRIDVFMCSCSTDTCSSYKQTLTVWKEMSVSEVITLALELHNETQPNHILPLDIDVYEARLYDDDDEGPDLDMSALQKNAVIGTLNLSALCILPISLSDTDEASTSGAVDYDSDFGEFNHTSQNRNTVVQTSLPVMVKGVSGPTGVTYTESPSVHAVGSNSKYMPPVLLGGNDDDDQGFEDADDYQSPIHQVNQDVLNKTPTNQEEMEFYIHALYSQFTLPVVGQYKEWHVVKTNTKGKRQERWMGLDRHFIYNRAAPKESAGLFANLGVSKESRPVLSISHCAVHPGKIHSLSISYKSEDHIDTRLYEAASPKECADIVARIRYLLNNP